MFENVASLSNIEKGLILMGFGVTGVFLVLIIFFFLIKLLEKAFPGNNEAFKSDS